MDANMKAIIVMCVYIFVLYVLTAPGTIITVGDSHMKQTVTHAVVFTAVYALTNKPVMNFIINKLPI
jgi:hypothetical protein